MAQVNASPFQRENCLRLRSIKVHLRNFNKFFGGSSGVRCNELPPEQTGARIPGLMWQKWAGGRKKN